MIYYNNENFDELVKNGEYLVDFYANWCGPCKMLASVLEELDKEINIIKIDVDSFSTLASRFKVMSIPYLLFIKDGKIMSTHTGFIDKETLEEKIKELKK